MCPSDASRGRTRSWTRCGHGGSAWSCRSSWRTTTWTGPCSRARSTSCRPAGAFWSRTVNASGRVRSWRRTLCCCRGWPWTRAGCGWAAAGAATTGCWPGSRRPAPTPLWSSCCTTTRWSRGFPRNRTTTPWTPWSRRPERGASPLGLLERQGVDGGLLHRVLPEGPVEQLTVDPLVGLVGVVRTEGVSRGTGEVDPPGLVPLAHVDDHPHGRDPDDLVAARRVPAGGVDRRLAAAEVPGTPVEGPLQEVGAFLAERLVAQAQLVQPAPAPGVHVLAELGGQLPARVLHGTGEELVAAVDRLFAPLGRNLPPVVVLVVQDALHDLVPAVAAVRLRRVRGALTALAHELVLLVHGTGAGDRLHVDAVTLGPHLLGELVAEGQLEDVAPHTVEVGGGGRVGLLGVVPALQQLLRLTDVLVRDADVLQHGHQLRGDRALVVHLHRLHVVGRDLLAVVDLLLDQVVDPLAAGAVAPVLGEHVLVVVTDDGLVGGDDVTALRVVLVRQLVERDELVLPAVLRVPAGARQRAVALLAHRDLAGRLVADVALGVRVDQVLRGHLEVRRRLAETGEVLGPVQLEDGVHRLAGVQCRPLQGDPVAVAAVGRVGGDGSLLADLGELAAPVGHQRAVVGLADRDLPALAARDLDGLLTGDEGLGLAVELVTVGRDLLQEEVGDVGPEVREAPGDVLVVADDHTGQSGERVAGRVVPAGIRDLTAVQSHLVPERGELRRQVRVVGQERSIGRRVVAGDDPGVRSDAVAVGAEQRRDLVQGVGERGELGVQALGRALDGLGTDAVHRLGLRVELPGDRGDRALADDRLVLLERVVRVEVLDLLRAEPAGHQRTVDLVLHVAAQVPGHRLQPGDRVDRGPLGGLVVVGQAECRVLDGEVLAVLALQIRVHPLRVRLEVLLGVLLQLGVVLLLRDLVPAQRAQEGVGLDLAGAEHLGEPSGRHVAAYVHLPETVLGLDVPLGAEEVAVGVGVDLRDT